MFPSPARCPGPDLTGGRARVAQQPENPIIRHRLGRSQRICRKGQVSLLRDEFDFVRARTDDAPGTSGGNAGRRSKERHA